MTLTPQQQHALAIPIHIGPLVLILSDRTSRTSPLSAVYHPGQNKILGVLKPGQRVVSHAEAVRQMEAALVTCGVTPEVSDFHLLKSESLLYVHYRLAIELDIGLDEPDLVIPEVILRNGYDGQIFCGLEYAVTQGPLSYRILIKGEPDSGDLQTLLTTSL